MSPDNVEEAAIVALERAALDRWCKGDPYGFVDNAGDDVTYFDHVTKKPSTITIHCPRQHRRAAGYVSP